MLEGIGALTHPCAAIRCSAAAPSRALIEGARLELPARCTWARHAARRRRPTGGRGAPPARSNLLVETFDGRGGSAPSSTWRARRLAGARLGTRFIGADPDVMFGRAAPAPRRGGAPDRDGAPSAMGWPTPTEARPERDRHGGERARHPTEAGHPRPACPTSGRSTSPFRLLTAPSSATSSAAPHRPRSRRVFAPRTAPSRGAPGPARSARRAS